MKNNDYDIRRSKEQLNLKDLKKILKEKKKENKKILKEKKKGKKKIQTLKKNGELRNLKMNLGKKY